MSSNYFLIYGARGVGKTSLLNRIAQYQPQAKCICLDALIEQKYGRIQDIFFNEGEPAFRQKEQKIFSNLIEELKVQHGGGESGTVYVAVGGGFTGEVPPFFRKVWVQRNIDLQKNFYLDRPSLENGRIDVSEDLWNSRQEQYKKNADEELLLEEGSVLTDVERNYFLKTFKNLGGIITLMPNTVRSAHFESWLKERKNWGVRALELRDDLLSSEDIEKTLLIKDRPQTVFSFRHPDKIISSIKWAQKCDQVDWPLEISFAPPEELGRPWFYSIHSAEESFLHDLKFLKDFDTPVKWSPQIETLEQLELAHQWQQSRPDQRSLLPRSQNGKWSWYRLYMKHKMPLNFFREGEGSSKDQPSLLQWASVENSVENWAAVLGSPVVQSESPTFHRDFFLKSQKYFFAVDATEEDLTKNGWSFLTSLGLVAAAVTSPLKKWATKISIPQDNSESVNTLVRSREGHWSSSNTDQVGLAALINGYKDWAQSTSRKIVGEHELRAPAIGDTSVALWGGEGVEPMVCSVLPSVHAYSYRTGGPRHGESPVDQIDVVIWAVGRWIWEKSKKMPPVQWKPKCVIDLNYKLDSPGILYAHQVSAKYISGEMMFRAQAFAQQKFWSEHGI